jgi:hypothetical protein
VRSGHSFYTAGKEGRKLKKLRKDMSKTKHTDRGKDEGVKSTDSKSCP